MRLTLRHFIGLKFCVPTKLIIKKNQFEKSCTKKDAEDEILMMGYLLMRK